MARQDVALELFYDDGSGADWQPTLIYAQEGVRTSRGVAEQTLEPRTGAAGCAVPNATGSYNPNNPVSPLYGRVGRFTPGRLVLDGYTLIEFEVADWKPRRTVDFVAGGGRGRAWTEIEGVGVLSRLTTGQAGLKSALVRAVEAASPAPVLWWPLDDGRDSDFAGSGLAGGAPWVELGELAFATVTGPTGTAGTYPELITSGAYGGGLDMPVTVPATGEWAIDAWVFVSGTQDWRVIPLQWTVSGTFGETFWAIKAERLSPFPALYNLALIAEHPSGTAVFNASCGDGWHHVRVTAEQVTGTQVDVVYYVDGIEEDSTTTSTFTIGTPTRIILGNYLDDLLDNRYPLVAPDSLSVSNVIVWDTITPPALSDAGTGYAGETAGERFLRLCGELGVTATVVGTASDSEPMGPQRPQKFTDLLNEIARTDAALVFETRTPLGLSMRVGRDLYNQDPVSTFSAIAGVAPPLEPTIGDYGVRNIVKASRANGSTAVATLAAGRMSVQAPPDGIGPVETQLDVEPETDARLIHLATWHLNRSTIEETRYRTIVIDLDKYPALVPDVEALDIGDRFDLADLPADESPDGTAAQVLISVDDNPGSHRRRVVLTAIPYTPFEIGIVGADDGSTDLRGQAVDTDMSTLDSGIDDNDTSLTVASTGGVVWTTDADDWSLSLNGGQGLRLMLAGEEMRVTNITGATSPQTFTVVRSVNGVVKSHAAGTPVHVRYPIIVGK